MPASKEKVGDRIVSWRYIPEDVWKVFEMDRLVGGIPRRHSVIRGLQRYGAPLSVRCKSGYVAESVILAGSVIDPGDVREVLPPTEPEAGLRTLRINLNRPIEIEAERHRVLWWDRSGKSVWLEPSPVCLEGALPRNDWWTVTLPAWAGEARAIGVAYQGKRRGSWWFRNWAEGLDEFDLQDVAQLLRWLKLPVLESHSRPAIDRFVGANFGVWLFDPPCPAPFRHGGDEIPWREVVRSLYGDRDVTHEQANRLADLAERDAGGWPRLAATLSEIHPLLLVKTVRAYIGDVTPGRLQEASALIQYLEKSLVEKEQASIEDDDQSKIDTLAREATSIQPSQGPALADSFDRFLERRPALRTAVSCACLKKLASKLH